MVGNWIYNLLLSNCLSAPVHGNLKILDHPHQRVNYERGSEDGDAEVLIKKCLLSLESICMYNNYGWTCLQSDQTLPCPRVVVWRFTVLLPPRAVPLGQTNGRGTDSLTHLYRIGLYAIHTMMEAYGPTSGAARIW